MAFEFKLPDYGEGFDPRVNRALDGSREIPVPHRPGPDGEIMTDIIRPPSESRLRDAVYISAIFGNRRRRGKVVKVGATLVVIEEESGAAPSRGTTSNRRFQLPRCLPQAKEACSYRSAVTRFRYRRPPAPVTPVCSRPAPLLPLANRESVPLASPSTRKLARSGLDIEAVQNRPAGTGDA